MKFQDVINEINKKLARDELRVQPIPQRNPKKLPSWCRSWFRPLSPPRQVQPEPVVKPAAHTQDGIKLFVKENKLIVVLAALVLLGLLIIKR